MADHKRKDDKLESATSSEYISCHNCSNLMNLESKELYWGSENPLRVLFLYRCSNCKKGKSIFDNGEEYIPDPIICEKCSSIVNTSYTRTDNKIDTIYTCSNSNCDYKDIKTLDLNKREDPVLLDPNYAIDKKRFLMSEKEVTEYVDLENQLSVFNEYIGEQKEREKNKDLYDKVASLKKLTIVEVEKLLKDILEKEGYINFHLDPPSIKRDIIVDFTVQESKSNITEHESSKKLKKLITETLINTNWRLMSAGINYRLGILSGSLRGYEQESELLKLVKVNI